MAAGFYSRRSRARDGAEPQLPKLLSVWSGGQPRPDSLTDRDTLTFSSAAR